MLLVVTVKSGCDAARRLDKTQVQPDASRLLRPRLAQNTCVICLQIPTSIVTASIFLDLKGQNPTRF